MVKAVRNKQSIAWFKLTECIGRGEKERALGLLRLLTHSLSDKPYTKKLEAELLLQCEERQAVAAYVQAAATYRSIGNLLEAATIYEILVALEPNNLDFLEKTISLFDELGIVLKKTEYQKLLNERL